MSKLSRVLIQLSMNGSFAVPLYFSYEAVTSARMPSSPRLTTLSKSAVRWLMHGKIVLPFSVAGTRSSMAAPSVAAPLSSSFSHMRTGASSAILRIAASYLRN